MPTRLEDLYREHAAPVWRYVRARLPDDADAEDVTSDVFLRAHRSLGAYDPAQGSSRAWLIGISRHAVADWWRRRGHEDPVADLPLLEADEPDPAAVLGRLEDVADVRSVVGLLSQREQEALRLRFAAELPSAEVGAAMGISAPAARMLVHRAVTKLREVLADG